MLVIRMQRTGRKGHAQFRVVVQDSRRTPTSGRIVASLGSFNPHTKTTTLDKEKVGFYLEHGAQPSDRVIRLLKSEGVKLPQWVKEPNKKERSIRNAEKLRKNQPAEPAEAKPEQEETQSEPAAEQATPAPAEAPATEDTAKETKEEKAEAKASDASVAEEKTKSDDKKEA